MFSAQAQAEYREGDPEWCPDGQVSYETRAKVLGVGLLVSWLVGLKTDFEHYARPVLRLLDTVLAHDGDLQGDDNIRYRSVCPREREREGGGERGERDKERGEREREGRERGERERGEREGRERGRGREGERERGGEREGRDLFTSRVCEATSGRMLKLFFFSLAASVLTTGPGFVWLPRVACCSLPRAATTTTSSPSLCSRS